MKVCITITTDTLLTMRGSSLRDDRFQSNYQVEHTDPKDPVNDDELHARLDDFRQRVDEAEVADAVEAAREETADEDAEHM